MKPVNYPKSLFLLTSLALCWSGSAALAQTTDEEEELAPILIGDPQDDGTEVAEEEFEDLVYDEEAQSYRLIEDDEPDDWVEPPSQDELDTEELKRLFALYREALENKEYLEADTLAKRVVELSIKLNGLDSHDSAKAIANLGIAQHNNKEYEAALLNFTASIGIVERIEDRLSDALINPLQGLAATQAAIGRPDLAKQTYERAVHVSHVNDGPHNPNQVQTLESMAELQISVGEYKDASNIQEHIYSIQARKIDPSSLEILPALRNKARWQHRLQQYPSERATWRQVINVIEDHHGRNSLELIPPLTNLGKSYLFVSAAELDYRAEITSTSGEAYLRRANRIAEKNPDADWRIVESTLLSLGDYYVLSGRPNRAASIYKETWQMLSEGEESDRIGARWEHLEQINVLQKVLPPKYYNSQRSNDGQRPPDNFETGSMTFSFTVAPTGRVSQIAMLETEPKELEPFSQVVGRSLRRLVYRPRTKEGIPVETRDVVYVHDFYYRPSDVPPSQPAPLVEETTAQATSPEDEE
jgi:tetratricopeptide (TPR) repeat protein